MAEVGVWGGDADGLAGLQRQAGRRGAEDRGEDVTSNSTGVDLLELQQGLVLLWKGGGHRSYTRAQYHVC